MDNETPGTNLGPDYWRSEGQRLGRALREVATRPDVTGVAPILEKHAQALEEVLAKNWQDVQELATRDDAPPCSFCGKRGEYSLSAATLGAQAESHSTICERCVSMFADVLLSLRAHD